MTHDSFFFQNNTFQQTSLTSYVLFENRRLQSIRMCSKNWKTFTKQQLYKKHWKNSFVTIQPQWVIETLSLLLCQHKHTHTHNYTITKLHFLSFNKIINLTLHFNVFLCFYLMKRNACASSICGRTKHLLSLGTQTTTRFDILFWKKKRLFELWIHFQFKSYLFFTEWKNVSFCGTDWNSLGRSWKRTCSTKIMELYVMIMRHSNCLWLTKI